MSATRPSRPRTVEPSAPRQPRRSSQLQAGRRAAERRRQLFRLDVAVGVLLALFLLVATPGLAIAAVLGGLMLVGCVTSVVLERRRRRRREI